MDCCLRRSLPDTSDLHLSGKTDVFQTQIETKQKELEPWNAKINKKQAEVDLASNERNMLAEKADAVTGSVGDANKNLEGLISDKEAKVGTAMWLPGSQKEVTDRDTHRKQSCRRRKQSWPASRKRLLLARRSFRWASHRSVAPSGMLTTCLLT